MGTGDALQANHAVVDGILVWEKELGSDRGHAISTRGITSLGIHKDCRDDNATYGGRRVVVAPSG